MPIAKVSRPIATAGSSLALCSLATTAANAIHVTVDYFIHARGDNGTWQLAS